MEQQHGPHCLTCADCMQPHGLGPQENVIKECEEEASIPRELAQRAVPAGAVSYSSEQSEGLKRDVLFCYDLELPLSFEPKPQVSSSCACLCHLRQVVKQALASFFTS